MADTVIDRFITEVLFRDDPEAINRIERGVNQVRAKLDALSTGFLVVGGALTGAMVGVGRTVLDFETEMNNLKAVLNATEEDMASLRDQAKSLGETTAFSASQAAAAQTELGKAGLSTQEIIAALPGVLSLAAAGQLDLSEASGIVTATLASFGLEAGEGGARGRYPGESSVKRENRCFVNGSCLPAGGSIGLAARSSD